MNRSERRRMEKEQEKQNKTLVISKQQLDNIKEEIRVACENEYNKQIEIVKGEWCNTAIDVIMNCMLIALHDECGFGKKRLQRLQKRAENHMDCMNKGYVTLDELRDINNILCEKAKYVGKRVVKDDIHEEENEQHE